MLPAWTQDAEGRIVKESRLTGRLDSYDVVKGFLVEVMIVYHCVNYFGGSPKALKYLDFVTGAFVLLSGRMVTSYYLNEYNTRLGLMIQRLLTRSVKLIVIFTVVNTCVHLALKKNYNGADFGLNYFYSNLYEVFILGSKSVASFEILLPIAYTLALGGILAFILKSRTLLGAVVSVILAVLFYIEDVPFNLKFLSLGLGGILYGCFRPENFSENAKWWLALSVTILVAAYMATVTVIDRDNLVIYFVGVCSIVQCISMVAENPLPDNWLVAALKLFGRYSLFSYLLQILALQFLFRALGREELWGFMVLAAVLITNVLLYAILYRLSSLGLRYQLVRVAYQKVFA